MQLTAGIANQEVLNRLKNAGPVFEEAASAFLKKSALIMISVAGPKAPRDKGTLGNSITSSEVKKSMGELSIEVGTNVEYAPYQEFGTGIYGPKKRPIVPTRGKVLAFKGSSGQMVFARSVKGVRPKKFMEAGVNALKNNPEIAFMEADKIIQRGL